jgi:hypothetical protein
MKLKHCLFLGITLFLCVAVNAQSITYSAPDRDDARNMNFEVLGKLQGNFLI